MVFSGCLDTAEFNSPPQTATENEKSVAEANNQFAFDLYSNISRNPEYADRNIFFSPFGISTSMAMVYEGARGDTADEIRSVFHFPHESDAMKQGYMDIFSDMPRDSQGDVLFIANGLWTEKSYPFLPDYIQNVKQYYSAKASNLDFVYNPEESRMKINGWAETNTKDKIHNLIPEGKITPWTRLVSTNAIYFSGTWEQPFDKSLTKDAVFFTEGNESVRVSMMHVNGISHYKFNYMITEDNPRYRNSIDMYMSDFRERWYQLYNATDDSFQMIELPYKCISGKETSMLIILPMGTNFTAFENSFDARTLAESKEKLQPDNVHVSMPKFTFETEYDLNDTLMAMGMQTAFDSSAADFSGMDGTTNLFLSDVLQKTYIDVNEEGTIAAAASASGVTQGIDPYFSANHPFIFIIQERETGNIIFMGRVINPNN